MGVQGDDKSLRKAATRSIGDWLDELGLSQYALCFAENDIDFTILRDLSDRDLKEIGVPSLGHRRRILNGIADLREVERSTRAGAHPITHPIAHPITDPLARPTAHTVPPASEMPPPDAGERRHVTVMFCDLVGSAALSTRMDPEDLLEVIAAYQKCVAETVRRFGGFVAKYMGDGVLVYFGYPQAHEDDAERSVRAGLELVNAVTALPSPVRLRTRVGIATGLVVVGDLVGSGEAQERGIVGETPNLAARLQGLAEPDKVIIAETTRKLLGNLFELQDLGPMNLKGIAGPMGAYAVLRASSVASRFEALQTSSLTALVGREEESDLLMRRWSRAKTGEGQVVLLSGEAGIGKSRLAAAALEHLGPEPHTRMRYFCSPQRTDSALYPIIGQMERAAGLALGDNSQEKLDKLDGLFARTSTSPRDATLFAEMLSLPNASRYPALELNPQQRRQRTLDALILRMETLTRQSPVLMIFEDLHWIDPTSLELLSRTVDKIAGLRALLILTFRPEFDPPWIGRPHVTALTLNRLAKRDVDAMIDRVIGNKHLLASVRQDIIERTDGIPLFVEEMTKAVLEAESEGEACRTAAAIPSPALSVPASLHASLMARLDRLGHAKEVAQIGAAIGREVSHALLASVVHKSEVELGAALDRLIEAGLLFRQGVPPHAIYLFKHALVQDAAYGTLLRDSRRALHARIAEALESGFPEIAENQPELLARHCSEASLVEKAADLWGKAGQRSLERSALVEGAEQLARALALIATLPATPKLRHEEINLQIALLNPLMHVKGYAAAETRAALNRAHLLIEEAKERGEAPEDPLLLFSVLYGFWIANIAAYDGDLVRELAAEFMALAEKQKAVEPLMIAHRIMGTSLLNTGDIAASRTHHDQAMALYDPARHRPLATRFGHDVKIAILAWRSISLWVLGYPDAALADADSLVKEAHEIGHVSSLMYALGFAPWTHICCGNYAAAKVQLDEVVALADEKGAQFWKAGSIELQGFAFAITGDASNAVQRITTAAAALRSTGTTTLAPLRFSYLAWAYANLGQFDEAWHHIREALAAIETTKEKWFEAEVHRIAGEIALLPLYRDAAKAQAYFEHALAVARGQQAKSWELRAATSLARLWRDQGKRDEARDLLAPVRGWFTQGFDTRDLREAKTLLDELAS
jgi:class 3 adenylate cyclase/predicted ATPase